MNETTEQTVAGVLPCPFCGSTEGFYVEEGCTFRWRVISCRSCGEGTEVRHKNNSDEPESYIADWNAAAPYPAMLRKEIETLRAQLAEPIDMVLHCPACGMQHIDAVEELPMPMPGSSFEGSAGWTNPPHRSHLCHGCGHIWRPADVPTNGVEAVKTCGKADSKLAAPTDTLRAQLAEAQRRIKELETPTMFWDFNNPEHGAFDSPYYAICDGDFDEGAEVSFMTARALPTKTVRVTRDSEGSYDYEYIDAAKGEPS